MTDGCHIEGGRPRDSHCTSPPAVVSALSPVVFGFFASTPVSVISTTERLRELKYLDPYIEVRWDLTDWPSKVDVSRLGPFVHWIRKHKPEFAPKDFDFDAFVRDEFPGVKKIWSLLRYKRRDGFVYDPIQWPTLCLTIEPAKTLERDLGKITERKRSDAMWVV
ncbi:hypothetical protein LTR66_004912 [Elasticomyces elasticus]|nr:hypothetical protein LTR66_004912 [Elasticomyces elasticus]